MGLFKVLGGVVKGIATVVGVLPREQLLLQKEL